MGGNIRLLIEKYEINVKKKVVKGWNKRIIKMKSWWEDVNMLRSCRNER